MKKVLVFAVDKTDMSDVCYVYREDVDSILRRFPSVDDWAKYIFEGCKNIEVASAMVVDSINILCWI